MTPCEELGYRVGDLFEAGNNSNMPYVKRGDIVMLIMDDGSTSPKFQQQGGVYTRNDGCWYLLLDSIKPIAFTLENE